MSYPKLPKGVFQNPAIEHINFTDGSFVSLIKLVKPYADGTNYAVYENTKSVFCSNGMFKSYEAAKAKFDLMVKNNTSITDIKDRGVCNE